jgi:hypothetical protein
MSGQNVLYLNPLGRNRYKVSAGFNERLHKKFYHIRDLFKKMHAENAKHNFQSVDLGRPPHHIYQDLSLNNKNYLLKMVEENEFRLDLYLKDEVPNPLKGRYSYTPDHGWVKTNKENLCNQLDYLMTERYFRMAINKEVEEKPDPKVYGELKRILENLQRPFDIRLKRTMRVAKGNVYEFSVSEVVKIHNLELCKLIGSMMNQPNDLDAIIRKQFINFYSEALNQANVIKWEIELELSRHTNK